MNTTKKQQSEGFTIIEVVLVLAIAALIMLMVFIALPALQRSQRDTQRKDDVSRLQSQISSYKSRNRGVLPTSGTGAGTYANLFTSEMRKANDTFADPSAGDYTPQVHTNTTMPAEFNTNNGSAAENAVIHLYPGGTCNGENVTGSVSSGARKVAIVKSLEGGGFQCLEA